VVADKEQRKPTVSAQAEQCKNTEQEQDVYFLPQNKYMISIIIR